MVIKTRTPHDALFKLTFQEIENIVGELRAVLPPELIAQLDLDSLELLPSSFIDEELSSRHSDLLYKVQFAGNDAWLFVLLEHQSTADPMMPYRLLRYMVRIWDNWLAKPENKNAKTLPPIFPVVMHHGKTGWQAAVDLGDLYAIPEDLRPTLLPYLPQFKFLLEDLNLVPDEDINARAMTAISRLVLLGLKHGRDSDHLAEQFVDWAPLLNEAIEQSNHEVLYPLICYLLQVNDGFDAEAISPLLVDDRLKEVVMTAGERLIQQGLEKGLERGREQGREEGYEELLLNLIRLKFKASDLETNARVHAAPVATVQRWANAILTAETLEELFNA